VNQPGGVGLNTNQPNGVAQPNGTTVLQPGTGVVSPGTPATGGTNFNVPPASQPGIQPPGAPGFRNVNPADPTRMNPNIADPTTPNPNISGFTTGGQGAGTIVGAQPGGTTTGTFVQSTDGTIFFIPMFDAFGGTNQQQQQAEPASPFLDEIPTVEP
jgi:hypothetical protein